MENKGRFVNGNKNRLGAKHSVESLLKMQKVRGEYWRRKKGEEYRPFDRKEYNKWYRNNNLLKQRDYLRNERMAVVEALGRKCVDCGFEDVRALQIDHVGGGGSKERKERPYKGSFHKHVLRSFLNNEKRYQLLCANCNWIKRSVNNELLDSRKGCIIKKNQL